MGQSLQAEPSNYVQGQWLLDHETEHCANCFAKFTFTLRRHHCRCCGEIFCSKCCEVKKTVSLPKKYEYDKPQRVCNVCYSFWEGRLKKLQVPRHVALVRYLANEIHKAGPPLLPENFNRGGLAAQQAEAEQQQVSAPVPLSVSPSKSRFGEREYGVPSGTPSGGVMGGVGSRGRPGSMGGYALPGSATSASSLMAGVEGGTTGLGTTPDSKGSAEIVAASSNRRASKVSSKKKNIPVKRYVEICSIKLANWRPLGKTTKVHFCKTPSLLNEIAQSSRNLKKPSEWEMPTPLPSSDRSRLTNRTRSEAGMEGERSVAEHLKEDEDYKNAAWTLDCMSVLNLVLDHSLEHGMDFITASTHDEVFYIQAINPIGQNGSQNLMASFPTGGPNGSMDGSGTQQDFCDADHFEVNASATNELYNELKELQSLMQDRVLRRQDLIETGKILANRSDSEVMSASIFSSENTVIFNKSSLKSERTLGPNDSLVSPYTANALGRRQDTTGTVGSSGGVVNSSDSAGLGTTPDENKKSPRGGGGGWKKVRESVASGTLTSPRQEKKPPTAASLKLQLDKLPRREDDAGAGGTDGSEFAS